MNPTKSIPTEVLDKLEVISIRAAEHGFTVAEMLEVGTAGLFVVYTPKVLEAAGKEVVEAFVTAVILLTETADHLKAKQVQ